MTTRPKRFLLFADILGTRSLYFSQPPRADLIEKKRVSLSHSIRVAFFPLIAENPDIHISIFSDTVLVACSEIATLLTGASKLFYLYSSKSLQAQYTDELFLLRGGIAYGEVLNDQAITPSACVDVSRIFDTGLALAYHLEGIRKGSRIFLCRPTFETMPQENAPCEEWKAVTGIGEPISPAFEYYWPVSLFDHDNTFCRFTNDLFTLWRTLFAKSQVWEVKDYDKALYQLDETIKLCVRSAAYSPSDLAVATAAALKGMLPTFDPQLAKLDIRFTWGTWFQILRTLLQLQEKHPSLFSAQEVERTVAETLTVVSSKGYMDTFLTELENPDYQSFGQKLRLLGLL